MHPHGDNLLQLPITMSRLDNRPKNYCSFIIYAIVVASTNISILYSCMSFVFRVDHQIQEDPYLKVLKNYLDSSSLGETRNVLCILLLMLIVNLVMLNQ